MSGEQVIEELKRVHDPLSGGENPKTPIQYEKGPLDENLGGSNNNSGSIILPVATLKPQTKI